MAQPLETVAILQVVERFATPENLRRLGLWAGDPHCMAKPLTLTALRVLSLNEIAVIEDDIQRSLAEAEKEIDKEAEANDILTRFLLWAAIPVVIPDFVDTESPLVDSFETPNTTTQDSDRTSHSAPVSTQITADNSFQNAVPGAEQDTHASVDGAEGGVGVMHANGGSNSFPSSKRAWTAIQNGVRSGAFFATAAAVLKRETLAQELEHQKAKVQEWLPEPVSKFELAPRPWTVMRLMESGCVECVSHEPHSMVLLPGSEAQAEILVSGSRSEMMGALKRVHKSDQRELQRLSLADQVGKCFQRVP
jgi:hypothetical protein